MSPAQVPPGRGDPVRDPPLPPAGDEGGEELLPGALRHAKRVVVAVVGTTLLLLGVVMLVTPGPGTLVLFFGLSVLAAEFAWARRWLRRVKVSARLAARRVTRR